MVGFHKVNVGDAELFALQDSWVTRDPGTFFAGVGSDAWAPYREWLDNDGLLVQNYGSFIIRSEGKTMLVDTGLGEAADPSVLKQPPSLLVNMERAGILATDIDLVLFTHLHWDHTGWNTVGAEGAWQLTFPNARYVIQQKELDYWMSPGEKPANGPEFDRVVAPVMAADRLEVVGDDYRASGEVSAVPTPGHTPGHVSFRIASGTESAFILGDSVHKPVQLSEPGWYPGFDLDPVESTRSRRMILDRAERENALLAGGHFEFPSLGYAITVDGKRTFRYVT
ncbi:MAG: MBL fold metallo-hydrolase [Acidimicrobiia bacterium]|nr:MBL fold metallo-hydrolase [Acidimicrobiia bacterium]